MSGIVYSENQILPGEKHEDIRSSLMFIFKFEFFEFLCFRFFFFFS